MARSPISIESLAARSLEAHFLTEVRLIEAAYGGAAVIFGQRVQRAQVAPVIRGGGIKSIHGLRLLLERRPYWAHQREICVDVRELESLNGAVASQQLHRSLDLYLSFAR